MIGRRTGNGIPAWPRLHVVRGATETRIVLAGPGLARAEIEATVRDDVLRVVLAGHGGSSLCIAVTLPRDADPAAATATRRGDHLTIRLPHAPRPDRSPRRLRVD